MKKRCLALLIIILALVCCINTSGFADETEGDPSVVPVVEPVQPTAVPPTAVPPTAVPPTAVPPTEVPPTEVPPTEAPIVTAVPTAIPTQPPTAPVILKSPGAEVVKSGEGCIFIAKAENYTGINWYFEKNGQIVYASGASKQFPGLKISGDGTEILSLESVPDSLNGWNVGAVFTNAYGKQGTTTCSITVTAAASPSPAATPSPKPSAAPTPTPSPTATTAPAATPDVTVMPTVSPDPELDETERGGFSIALLLVVVLLAAILAGLAVLLIFSRKGRREESNKPGNNVRKHRYDDDEDEIFTAEASVDPDYDEDDGKRYKGKH